MPDWERYRETFLNGNLKAQNLVRLQTMERWLSLPFVQCAAAAQAAFQGQSEDVLRPWYRLSRVLYLKLMKDAGFEGPAAAQQLQALYAAYQNGTATPEEFHRAESLYNIGQIGAVLTGLYPDIAQLSPGTLAGNALVEKIGPISERLMSVHTTPGLVNPATVEDLKAILGEFEQLCQDAAPDNTARPNALYFCGATAEALGDASTNLGDSTAALDWYARSGEFFDQADDGEHAGQSRQKAAALELRVTGDIDRATQRILGSLFDPDHPPEPLPMAMAYADLSQVMGDAGDAFGAGEAAGRAAIAFEKLGFLDPEKVGADAALDSWVARSCEMASGKSVYELLMRVCKAYLSVYSGRVAQYAASDPARAQRNEELANGMDAISSRITAETEAAENGLARAIQVYFPQMPAPKETPDDHAFQRIEQNLSQVDGALLELRQLTNQLRSAGQPVQPVLGMLDGLEPLVKALRMPLYEAKWKLGYAYTQMAAGEAQKALEAAEEARTVLLAGRPARLSSFSQAFERTVYLDALLQKMRALMTLGQLKDGLETCLATIADFEESRYRVNSPLRQSAHLQSTVEFYTGAAFAAFKLKEWDTLLQVTELVKARSAIRSRLSVAAPELQTEALMRQFHQITAALQDAGNPPDAARLEDLQAKRRDVWDLLAIARARAAGAAEPPLLSLQAVQRVLAPDEAVLGYFFLAPTVLLIMMMDRERFDVERIVFNSEDEMAPVNDLLDAIEGMAAGGLLDLDAAIQAAGEILLPVGVREFIQAKARVIVSPHHGLHLFPFHAASWDGKFLVERSAVRYIPNFSSLLLEWRGPTRTGVFALAVSRFNVAGEPCPDLANAEEEAREIAGLYAGLKLKAEAVTGASATTEVFRQLASGSGLSAYSALHLATHGTSVFAGDAHDEPMESKLMLQDGWIDGLELATFHLPADVAVLSACNSGQRAVGGRGMSSLPGDDIFGLQSALFQAGVHTVLGGLWTLETQAACAVTSEFHRNYAKGDAAEMALRKALLRWLKEHGGAETILWAPFFLSSLGTAAVAQAVH
ncbi:MAG: CHAT domain-containing protein [Bryobacteraceae bacterium]